MALRKYWRPRYTRVQQHILSSSIGSSSPGNAAQRSAAQLTIGLTTQHKPHWAQQHNPTHNRLTAQHIAAYLPKQPCQMLFVQVQQPSSPVAAASSAVLLVAHLAAVKALRVRWLHLAFEGLAWHSLARPTRDSTACQYCLPLDLLFEDMIALWLQLADMIRAWHGNWMRLGSPASKTLACNAPCNTCKML